jgi:osmoprotectant transport system permease protein
MRRLGPLLAVVALAGGCGRDREPVRVGSKAFTESVILGELATQRLRERGVRAIHRRQLGGTQVLWRALVEGSIDLYAEYVGTLREEIFARRAGKDARTIEAALAADGVRMSAPLGFDNTYAVGMREERAARLGIRTLSDLAAHPELRLGWSNEFMDRRDGWPGLRDAYRLPQRDVRGLDHDLAYRGLVDGTIDATDLYSTDAEIRIHQLRVLVDDRHYFPDYHAVWLYRADLGLRAPEAVAAIDSLVGRISDGAMVEMNARARRDRVPETVVAADFLATLGGGARPGVVVDGRAARILRRTGEHLTLVGISLAAAIAIALPLGVAAARRPRLGRLILGATGVVQTIPSLALLVFMIPLLGIGAAPAMVALFLYGLLPIVRNTAAGLQGIPPSIRESAEALGLPPAARLRLVELPLAARSILAGVKTSAVIAVGTATLGALVGAGGYGQPILTGIRLDDVGLILEGAVPAALLALGVEALFDRLEHVVVPKGLQRGGETG